jgi:hypothetical protein
MNGEVPLAMLGGDKAMTNVRMNVDHSTWYKLSAIDVLIESNQKATITQPESNQQLAKYPTKIYH